MSDGLDGGSIAPAQEAPPASTEQQETAEWLAELDDETREFVEKSGFKSPADLAKSLRDTKGELTRVSQNYSDILDSMVEAEDIPAAGFQQPPPVQGGYQNIGEIPPAEMSAYIAHGIQTGEFTEADAMVFLTRDYYPAREEFREQQLVEKYIAPQQLSQQRAELEGVTDEIYHELGDETFRKLAPSVLPRLQDPKFAEDPELIRDVFYAELAKQEMRQKQQEMSRRRSESETLQDTVIGQRQRQSAADAILAQIEKAGPPLTDGL